jgi:hypothetical protein
MHTAVENRTEGLVFHSSRVGVTFAGLWVRLEGRPVTGLPAAGSGKARSPCRTQGPGGVATGAAAPPLLIGTCQAKTRQGSS